jgi:hypothetical protein
MSDCELDIHFQSKYTLILLISKRHKILANQDVAINYNGHP